MVDITEENRRFIQIQQEYINYLDDIDENPKHFSGVYPEPVKEMIKNGKQRLMVSINHLRDENGERCQALLQNGFEEMPLFQKALREVVIKIDEDYAKKHDEFFISLKGSFGPNHTTPRNLTSEYLARTVCVEGIVTKCSLINPKIVRSFHYCPATKKTSQRQYSDVSSFDSMPSVSIYPTKDDEGNLLETEYGLSKYRDHQMITIQEMPERAPTGQLPRSLDVIFDNDLVDSCKPGDRVLIVGVFRCLPGKKGGVTTGVFRSILLANHVTKLLKDINVQIHEDFEIRIIRKFSKLRNVFELLAKSLAPSIHGHMYIKKALLCLLLGGVEKTLNNGTRLRGDINILLIGDPSVAKSQMLRYVGNVAPRVVLTTGRGSSGVGLTAAVTTDYETGERRLEAGAMVLGDRGVVCIDEFDKMSDADRTSIHEVMEQGKVTIAKAGIHARLNARTSVLAAANPLYGRYDTHKTPMENIGLQDSLLSRFDLLFIVKDVPDITADGYIAEHVLRMHRYRNPIEEDGKPTPLQTEVLRSTEDPDEVRKLQNNKFEVYEVYDALLHGKCRTRGDKILSMDFIRRYIAYAKSAVQPPKMTSEASRIISEEYTRLRSANLDDGHLARTQPITARNLETMIRLAAAHAKARFSSEVTKEDAYGAIELVKYAIFEKVEETKKKRKINNEDSSDVDDDEVEEVTPPETTIEIENEDNPSKRSRSEHVTEQEEMDTSENVVGLITDNRFSSFRPAVSDLFHLEHAESLTKRKLIDWLSHPERGFTEAEIIAGFERLSIENLIIENQGIVFLNI